MNFVKNILFKELAQYFYSIMVVQLIGGELFVKNKNIPTGKKNRNQQ